MRLGKFCLALFVLLKGMDIPKAGSNTKTSFVKELAGFSEASKVKMDTGYGEVLSGPRGKTEGLDFSSLQNGSPSLGDRPVGNCSAITSQLHQSIDHISTVKKSPYSADTAQA